LLLGWLRLLLSRGRTLLLGGRLARLRRAWLRRRGRALRPRRRHKGKRGSRGERGENLGSGPRVHGREQLDHELVPLHPAGQRR